MMLVGLTALSVEIMTNFSASNWTARSAMIFVPNTLTRSAS